MIEPRTYTCPRCAVAFEATVGGIDNDRLLCPTCTTIVHNFRSAVEDARGSLSRAEAARRTGIPLRTLENWESGVRVPRAYARDGIIRQLQDAARP